MAQYERKDHLYRRAKAEGYRSRAAYKLIELDKKLDLLGRGLRVVDLGAWPGGWLQVAVRRVKGDGVVIGVDLKPVEPFSEAELQGAPPPVIITGDILEEATREAIRESAGGTVDVVLSDMSPQLSGFRFRDAARAAELVEMALETASELLDPSGSFVAKIFPGAEADEVAARCRERFRRFRRVTLGATRKGSSELYIVGRELRGG